MIVPPGGHFNINNFFFVFAEADRVFAFRVFFDFCPVREHQFGICIFMIDHQKPAIEIVFKRNKADIVIVVAKMFGLRFPGLVHGIKFGRVGKYLIASAQKNVRVIALRDTVLFISFRHDLFKIE